MADKKDTTSSLMASIANRVNTITSKSEFNYKNIDIERLVENENNKYGLREIEELAESIKDVGLLQSLLVEPIEDGKYKIISGHRRHAAVKLLGWERVECKIREDFDDIDSQIALHRANDFRELSTSEKAAKVVELEKLYKMKKEKGDKVDGKIRDKVGKDMGLSGMQVQRLKSIHYKLIDPLKELLDQEKITMANAAEFSLLSEEQQTIAYNFLMEHINASKIEIEALKESLKKKTEENKSLQTEKDTLDTKVKELEVVAEKNKEKLKQISDGIEDTKNKITEEIKKKVGEQNAERLQQLENQLKNLEGQKKIAEEEKNKIAQEKDLEINSLKEVIQNTNNSTNVELEDIQLNAEAKLIIKNFRKSSSELLLTFTKLENTDKKLSNENVELIKKIKETYKEQLDNLFNKYI